MNLLNLEVDTDRKLKSELVRARNREKIAQSKLNCLKARFEGVVDELSGCKAALLASHYHLDALQKRLDEALMAEAQTREELEAWKAKAFEKMDEKV